LIIGVLGVANQVRIKRLLAFSSIHHLGWILICNCIYDYGCVNYLLVYSIIILSVIIIFSKYEGLNFNFIGRVNEKYLLILGLLSMGGMPPILGFFLKW